VKDCRLEPTVGVRTKNQKKTIFQYNIHSGCSYNLIKEQRNPNFRRFSSVNLLINQNYSARHKSTKEKNYAMGIIISGEDKKA